MSLSGKKICYCRHWIVHLMHSVLNLIFHLSLLFVMITFVKAIVLIRTASFLNGFCKTYNVGPTKRSQETLDQNKNVI